MFNPELENDFLNVDEIKKLLRKGEGANTTVKHSTCEEFYKCGNKLFKEFRKEGVITVVDEEELHLKNTVTCNVLGCNEVFTTVFAFESHYNSLHRYICSQCKKSLPSPHLLDLHLSEQHDSFFAVLSKKQPMFLCYLEECKHKSSTPENRKDHCIKVHQFPSNYRFDNFSLKKASATTNTFGKMSMEVDILNSEESNDGKIPFTRKNANFSFGHAKIKTFSDKSYAKSLSKHGENKDRANTPMDTANALENSQTIVDLMESLP